MKAKRPHGAAMTSVHAAIRADVARTLRTYAAHHGLTLGQVIEAALAPTLKGFVVQVRGGGVKIAALGDTVPAIDGEAA